MTKLLGLLLLTACFLFPETAAPKLDQLQWLTGAWTATSARGALIEEHWIAPAGGLMLGLGRVSNGAKLFSFEFLRIVERPDSVVYIAQPQGRPPTEFKLTSSAATEAVFENPQHDHPKKIVYRVNPAGELQIELSGAERAQSFTLRRVTR